MPAAHNSNHLNLTPASLLALPVSSNLYSRPLLWKWKAPSDLLPTKHMCMHIAMYMYMYACALLR